MYIKCLQNILTVCHGIHLQSTYIMVGGRAFVVLDIELSIEFAYVYG